MDCCPEVGITERTPPASLWERIQLDLATKENREQGCSNPPPQEKDQGVSNPVAAQNQGCVFVGGRVGGRGEEKKKENILFGSSTQAVFASESSYNKGMCS